MKAILIDDEPNSSRNLERKLMMVCPEIDVIASCTNVQEGISAIEEFQPDIVFLDMELGAEEGFEILDSTKQIAFDTIVVTMHTQYAKDAFNYNVTHFLTKPIQKEQLREAVDRILEKKKATSSQQLQLMQNKVEMLQMIGIRLANAPDILFLKLDQIGYCESDGNRTRISLVGGQTYTANGALGDFTKVLEAYDFIRIHNQYLINLIHLERYQRSTQNVFIRGKKKPLSVSNNYKGDFIVKIREITVRSGF